MGVRAPQDLPAEPMPPPRAPTWWSASGLAALLLVALVSNGRPIPAADNETADPLSSLLATPLFVLARLAFPLDQTGADLVGKLGASLLSAAAAGVLFVAIGRRRPHGEAGSAATVFALGTTVWATSQDLWPHPATVLFVSLALLFLLRSEDEDGAWAARAGLPIGLAFAAHHASVALCAALWIAAAVRWPRRIPHLLLWSLPGPAVVALLRSSRHGFPLPGGPERLAGPWTSSGGEGHLGLLVSPGKGLFVFTPVALLALLGLVRAFRGGERFVAATAAAAFTAHFVFVGLFRSWPGGDCWGPRLLTDALPLLFLFLPWGRDAAPRLGAALAAVSIGVQALGAFAYDHRWERRMDPSRAGGAALWSWTESPVAFHLRERVLIFARPALRDGRAVVREHRLVLLGKAGSRIRFEDGEIVVEGVEANAGDVHPLGAARVEGDRLLLLGPGDGLFLRVKPRARGRILEIRIRGRGQGPLSVAEATFWTPPRVTTHQMQGTFSLRHRWEMVSSGGPDLAVSLGRGPGQARIESVSLVPPSDPEAPVILR